MSSLRKRIKDYASQGWVQRLAKITPEIGPGLHDAEVRHDDDCNIFLGGMCSCVPDIIITAHPAQPENLN